MNRFKTRSIEMIEDKMGGIDEDSLRHKVLSSAKGFKTSWIDLGQSLYSVWKDKLYKEWGYMTFDAYTSKEIGVRKDTALKLVRSYYFLEKEEPSYVDKDYIQSKDTSAIPSYDSVNVLRLAKSKKELDTGDYINMRKDVLEMGKDAKEVKKDLTALMKQREEIDPDEARKKKKLAMLRRLIGTMKSLKRDLEASKMVSAGIIKDISAIINKVETEIE